MGGGGEGALKGALNLRSAHACMDTLPPSGSIKHSMYTGLAKTSYAATSCVLN